MASIANHKGSARLPSGISTEPDNRWPEYGQALLVWAIYAFVQLVILPAVMPESWYFARNAETIFAVCFHGVIAFCLTFPLKDWLLARQHYVLFAAIALGILLLSSVSLELFINPSLFGSLVIPGAIYSIFIDITSITLLLLAVRLLANRRRSERRLAALEQAKTEAELENLKAQINPHILFNALNNIYSHALHRSDKTPELILKLSDMLRYMIYDCADDAVSLAKEMAFLSDYIAIQKMALDDRGAVDVQFHGDFARHQIAPFLLIPFVENCFKHSLDTLETDIAISIGVTVADGRLQLSCANGYDPDARKEHSQGSGGIGLANVKRRLALLYADDYSLDIAAQNGEYRVMLNIPVQS